MIKKASVIIVLFAILLYPRAAYAEGIKYIEIFDPKQNEVVKVIQLTLEINNMVTGWIKRNSWDLW